MSCSTSVNLAAAFYQQKQKKYGRSVCLPGTLESISTAGDHWLLLFWVIMSRCGGVIRRRLAYSNTNWGIMHSHNYILPRCSIRLRCSEDIAAPASLGSSQNLRRTEDKHVSRFGTAANSVFLPFPGNSLRRRSGMSRAC